MYLLLCSKNIMLATESPHKSSLPPPPLLLSHCFACDSSFRLPWGSHTDVVTANLSQFTKKLSATILKRFVFVRSDQFALPSVLKLFFSPSRRSFQGSVPVRSCGPQGSASAPEVRKRITCENATQRSPGLIIVCLKRDVCYENEEY